MSLDKIRILDFQDTIDDRGRLTAIEGNQHAPFSIERVFYVHQVKQGTARGGHAHKDTDQVLLAPNGVLKVDLCDGKRARTYLLDHPARGLYVPRMIWTRMYDFSLGAVLLVLASTKYDRGRSLRTWSDYLRALGLDWTQEPVGELSVSLSEVLLDYK